jgi:regulator of replication initiation timing
MARTGATADLQPIDRLEDKVKLLVGLVDTLRAEKMTAVDEAARLQQEVASLKARLTDAAGASAEVATLRDEREAIRTRVVQMIATIDKLDL